MKKIFFLFLTFIGLINPAFPAKEMNNLKSDQTQVDKWNNFVSELYELHLDKTKDVEIETREIIGGYGGGFNNKKFYREISYLNKHTQQLISKIQWEIKNPDRIHTIEVFLYNEQNKVKTDFYARYLPYARNAPVQTLINLHNYDDQLHSFRQFDANGELIYETCRGKYFDQEINLHLDDEEILYFRTQNTDELLNEAYATCFMNVAKTATDYLNPSKFIKSNKNDTTIPIELEIEILSQKLEKNNTSLLHVARGNLYFHTHEFDKAIDDFNIAILLDEHNLQAYFERGMALARNGEIEAGIKDLTYFIKFNPKSSLAYTKRGVRYIWTEKLDLAKADLLIAVKLDKTNSEAHDDLGVLYAHDKILDKAIEHFSLAIQHDPAYQKAYHNIAMALYLKGEPRKALSSVNKALSLDADSRNSLILKSEILNSLGDTKNAESIMRKAEFLPEGNWSERFTIEK